MLFHKIILFALSALFLVACSGGGGSDNPSTSTTPTTPTTPTPGNPPPSESRASQELPDLFEANFAESGGLEDSFTTPSFTFTAPGNELPVSLMLTGADAEFFQTSLEASQPDSRGIRNVTLTINSLASFNFEEPADENADNVYEFELSGEFAGENLTARVVVTINDIPDAAEAHAGLVSGEFNSQTFGAELIRLPDLDSDGMSELGVPIRSGEGGPAASYVLTSSYLSSLIGSGAQSVASATDFGSRLLETAPKGMPLSNFVSGAVKTRGEANLLISEAAKNRLLLVNLSDADDFNALAGDVNLDTLIDPIIYQFTGGENEGRLLGDINGDGQTDIFVRPITATSPAQAMGIIFGRNAGSEADRSRTGEPDIVLSADGVTGFSALDTFVVELVNDIDGDDYQELLMAFDTASGPGLWLIRGSALQSAGAINIEALTPAQGFKIAREVVSISETSDYDDDGFANLVFATSSFGIYLIDGDDFSSLNPSASAEPFGDGAAQIELQGRAIAATIDAGDLNGDGDNELLAVTPQQSLMSIIDGADLRTALTRPGLTSLSENQVLELDLSETNGFAQFKTATPLHMNSGGFYVFGFGVQNSITDSADDSGRLILVAKDDVSSAFNTGSIRLKILLPE